MSKKKRVITICVFCLLLGVVGVFNIVLNNKVSATTNNTVTTGNFFTNYKTDRTTTYDKEIMYLNAIIDSASTSQDAKTNAEAELLNMVKTMNLQAELERLITAKGFNQVVVSALDNYVSIIVNAEALSDSELAQIVDIIESSSDYTIENIKIIPVE